MSNAKIIVCDDESYVVLTLSSKLKQQGYDVRQAGNGAEALRLAAADPPDLVVTDYQMPAMSGYEMAVALKAGAATSAVPVIMLTARGHLLSPEELARTNIRQMLPKPFSVRDVLAHVTRLLAPDASSPTGGGTAGAAGAPTDDNARDAKAA
jgi:DNA-binding response OmpR family regulator